jgi:hypothetical protein
MAYIGQSPSIGNFQVCDAISVVNGQAAYTMQVSSVNVVPETANHMIVSLNGIIQAPGSSYTVSGSTITFASNLVTGDVINFIHILGSVLDLGVPSDDTVSTAKISANAVTAAKFNADVISGQTALATEPADTDEFLVSDAGVLKRIDYSLIKGGGQKTLLSTTTVSSAVSEVDITSNIDSTYARYEITVDNFSCATHAALLYARFFQGGSVDTGGVYDWTLHRSQSSNTSIVHTKAESANQMELLNEVREVVAEPAFMRITLYNPSSTASYTNLDCYAVYSRDGGNLNIVNGAGRIEETAAVDGIRFYMSSGNIDSGVFKLYGIT